MRSFTLYQHVACDLPILCYRPSTTHLHPHCNCMHLKNLSYLAWMSAIHRPHNLKCWHGAHMAVHVDKVIFILSYSRSISSWPLLNRHEPLLDGLLDGLRDRQMCLSRHWAYNLDLNTSLNMCFQSRIYNWDFHDNLSIHELDGGEILMNNASSNLHKFKMVSNYY